MPAYNKFRLFSFIIIPQCGRCWEKKTDIDHFFMKMKKKNAPATTNHNRISASLVWNVINQKCVIISHAAFTLRAIFVWLIWFCVQTKQKMIHNCKHFHYFIVSFCLCFLVAAAIFALGKWHKKIDGFWNGCNFFSALFPFDEFSLSVCINGVWVQCTVGRSLEWLITWNVSRFCFENEIETHKLCFYVQNECILHAHK